MPDTPTWKQGDIVNFHILLDGRWSPLTPKHETDGGWQAGDLVNGYVCNGREWISAPPSAFMVYPAAPTTRPFHGRRKRGPREAPAGDVTVASQDAVAPFTTRRERAEARRRAGRKPRKPRRQRAYAAWVGLPPSSTVWDISSRCVKCGRPLTNPNSQRHRVGTDCIKRYGSQARKIPNPAYAQWSARKARADADRIARQVVLDAEYAGRSLVYEQALADWRAIRAGQAVGSNQ